MPQPELELIGGAVTYLLDRLTAGRYLVRGEDTAELPEAAVTALRARQFCFVFQSFHLLPDRTAIENAELGLLYRKVPRRLRRDLVIGLLRELNSSGLTVIIVTHDQQIADSMPRQLRIDDGVVTQVRGAARADGAAARTEP